jgi:Holliday junction DNA helicase RuvA
MGALVVKIPVRANQLIPSPFAAWLCNQLALWRIFMIATVHGTINQIADDHLVIGVGGVGIRVFVPRTVLEDVGGTGRNINLHTHLIVRETDLTLYGFETPDDLSLFQLLLEVNGVGPKVALAILSTLSPELFKSAIVREEAAVLQRVPGIGKKTAERIMFQLRDKVDAVTAAGAMPLVSDVDADVIELLTNLGFSIVEAQSALQKVPREVKSVDERLQRALQYLDEG